MIQAKLLWRTLVYRAAQTLASEKGASIDFEETRLPLETPPKPELGDLAIPTFALAKSLRSSPAQIAVALYDILSEAAQGKRSLDLTQQQAAVVKGGGTTKFAAVGPYLNIHLDRVAALKEGLSELATSGIAASVGRPLSGKRIMVEFSCPNTNKPLHLGHLRNDALGESLSRILAMAGAEVQKVNLVNNRGIHICKSMLAYQKFSGGETPESADMKSDHFVGKYYVRYAQWEKENPSAEHEAQKMLVQWESGDPEIVELWERMNRWALDGIQKTYEATGISFDRYYFESDTYLLGRQRILDGLAAGVFYKDEEGTVWIDLSEIGLDKKVVLRKDGTSVYITQDIGTAIARHEDFPFDSLVYVVASEQQYHFRVLFYILGKLGYEWAAQLYHLSYGMVNLPDGKMKSREGTVVDADDLLEELSQLAKEEIRSKNREDQVGSIEKTSREIALGALHYYLLQTSPTKDMVFDPKESLAFNGNTGPYLQYTCARIFSMLAKPEAKSLLASAPDYSLLVADQEWELFKILSDFGDGVAQAAIDHNPALVCAQLYELAKAFSRFYHDLPVLNAGEARLATARLALCRRVHEVLSVGMNLMNIPVLDAM